MSEQEEIEIMLVEDNNSDAELTLHALKKCNVSNHVVHVRDGAEALDLLFCRGEYAARDARVRPILVLLDFEAAEGGRAAGVETDEERSADASDSGDFADFVEGRVRHGG